MASRTLPREMVAGTLARVRGWATRHVFRHHGEVCDRCGHAVSRSTGDTWWEADDDLWLEVIGTDHGIRCIPCFTREAQDARVGCVVWKPTLEP